MGEPAPDSCTHLTPTFPPPSNCQLKSNKTSPIALGETVVTAEPRAPAVADLWPLASPSCPAQGPFSSGLSRPYSFRPRASDIFFPLLGQHHLLTTLDPTHVYWEP